MAGREAQRDTEQLPKLSEQHLTATRARIVEAALGVTSQHGLTATVEDIATAAGVGRRTVFRYFGTRDELLATALSRLLEIYEADVPRHGPARPEDLPEWLIDVATTIHRLNHDVLGRLFWDVHDVSPGLAPELAAVIEQRRDARLRWTTEVARHAWKCVGGHGAVPRWASDTTATLLSAFTTNALAGDLGRTPEEIAAVTARVLTLTFVAAVEDQGHRKR
ncbi:MAG: transcriptional regulator, TetR family [Acidimicrobiia bacterium]|nr:transcriptional regulator, TetR family [Acidimicrobiia bacterium]